MTEKVVVGWANVNGEKSECNIRSAFLKNVKHYSDGEKKCVVDHDSLGNARQSVT